MQENNRKKKTSFCYYNKGAISNNSLSTYVLMIQSILIVRNSQRVYVTRIIKLPTTINSLSQNFAATEQSDLITWITLFLGHLTIFNKESHKKCYMDLLIPSFTGFMISMFSFGRWILFVSMKYFFSGSLGFSVKNKKFMNKIWIKVIKFEK